MWMMKRSNLDPLKTSSYDYSLPKELIATHPVTPADSAKLLVYNRAEDTITHTTYKNLLDFIPDDTSIFLNDTKVIKARIFGTKESGGKIELLLNKPLPDNQFLCYIRGRVKVSTKLLFTDKLFAIVKALHDDGSRLVEFFVDDKLIDFLELVHLLNEIGHIPLPPYINREDKKSDDKDYQTLFAKNYGAVAAPTASLHFTPELLANMKKKFDVNYLTLHVGAGTFKPVEAEDILEHPMHSEYFEIDTQTKDAIDGAKKVLAVGTTVTRTLEYYKRTAKTNGECDLFLNPSNQPQIVDHLLTNFHLPKSTLIMLIASFVGLEKTLEIYETAIENRYRFYSYGDGMLIL
jgi:S-adenosylmethionine:tRNA ribosyltransferase-isomerase